MKKIFFILSCLLISTSLLAQTRIGVYVAGVLDENYKTLLANKLVEAFTESSDYVAVNRSAALKPLLEKARYIQQSGHIDYTQIVSSDNTYGEALLCGVNIYQVDEMYIFDATLLDMKTNSVTKTASAEVAKSEIGYTKILEIAQKLSTRLISGTQQTSSDFNALKATSDVALAKKKVEENRQYDISYAAFKQEYKKWDEYSQHSNAAVEYYLTKSYKTKFAGDMMWLIPPIVGLGVGLGAGLADIDKDMKLTIICSGIAASFLPTIICYCVAPGYKRKAWKEYRKPYDNAVKDLERAQKYQQRASLEFSPAVGYDWAGISLRFKFK